VAVNLIVLVVTLLMAGFVAVWVFCPRLRSWMEAPKYRFLEQERRFPDIAHERAEAHPSGQPPR
jgi:hypothetical protein